MLSQAKREETRKRIESVKRELGKKFVSKMYDNIDYKTLKNAVDNAKWILVNEHKTGDPDLEWAISCYSRQSSIQGSTDYFDHRSDTIDDIKNKVYSERYDVKKRLMQNLHYYNIKGKIFDTIVVKLNYGSWSIDPYWSDNQPGFSSVA